MISPSKLWPVRRDSNPLCRGLHVSYVRASPTIDATASHLQTPAFSPEFSLSDYVHPYSLTFAPHCIESQQHGRSLPGSLHRLDDTTERRGLSSLPRVPEMESTRIS